MTSPGSYEQHPNAHQPYPPQQPAPQPQFAHPSAPLQPLYAQQPAQPQGQPTSWRTLTVDLKQPPWYGYTWLKPTVTIDGYSYGAQWTRCSYQVPADRPVHVQCHVNYLWEYGKAAAILQPNHMAHLEYTAPAQAWYPGDIGAPGTTQANGKGFAIGILVVACAGLLFALFGLALSILSLGMAVG
jgi:hypothetical protein